MNKGERVLKQRPALRWHGGKFMLAPWIISNFPPHRQYTESFGGAASVLLRKERVYFEVYNDLDDEVVNFFRVLQNLNDSKRLTELLELTPYSRLEFKKSYEVSEESIERARRLVIRSFMGFGSNAHNVKIATGFRANSSRSGTTPTHDWVNYPKVLHLLVSRLQGVVIEHRDAREVMLQHDKKDTLHYVDPPYVFSTRSDAHMDYHTEMTDEQHKDLLIFLGELRGIVVLSGYSSPLYEQVLKRWKRVERVALADGARPRKEILWIKDTQHSGRL